MSELDWYSQGTCSVTNGSTTVTFAGGTDLIANARRGEIFFGPDRQIYKVASIESATQMTISPSYTGSTASSQAYQIIPVRGRVNELLASTTSILTAVQEYVDGPLAGRFADGSEGSPALAFAGQTNTGLYRPEASVLALSVNGSERMRVTPTGVGVGSAGTNSLLSVNQAASNKYSASDLHHSTFTVQTTNNNGNGQAASIYLKATGNGGMNNARAGISLVQPSADFNESELAFQLRNINGNISEVMRLKGNGNVGIGTTQPERTLVISDGQSRNLEIGYDANAGIETLAFDRSQSLALEVRHRAKVHKFATGSTTATSERMRIDEAGNVGIGLSDPTRKLHVEDARSAPSTPDVTASFARKNGANNPEFQIRHSTDGTDLNHFWTAGAQKFSLSVAGSPRISMGASTTATVFSTGSDGAERMRITPDGDLLIGQSSSNGPGFGNTTTGAAIRSSGRLFLSSNDLACAINRNADGTIVAFYNSGSIAGAITTSGTTTSYNTSSDARLKHDAHPMQDAADRLMALRPVNFAWKASGERTDGFIAHEAQQVAPYAVTGEKDAVDADGNPEYQQMDHSKLVPLLTAALQDAFSEIADLRARLDAANL